MIGLSLSSLGLIKLLIVGYIRVIPDRKKNCLFNVNDDRKKWLSPYEIYLFEKTVFPISSYQIDEREFSIILNNVNKMTFAISICCCRFAGIFDSGHERQQRIKKIKRAPENRCEFTRGETFQREQGIGAKPPGFVHGCVFVRAHLNSLVTT